MYIPSTLCKKHNMVNGLPTLKNYLYLSLCEGCMFGEQIQSSYPTSPSTRAIAPLALIHTNLGGPINTPPLGGALSFLSFIDDYFSFTHIYFLIKKSSTLSYFQTYKTSIENHHDKHKKNYSPLG